jgi:hypothetical protein
MWYIKGKSNLAPFHLLIKAEDDLTKDLEGYGPPQLDPSHSSGLLPKAF